MDNFYQNCPAKMNDARFLRDNRTSHRRELYNMQANGLNRSDDYRLFLQKNAENIMDAEWCKMTNEQSCHNYPCFHNYPTRSTPGMLNNEMAVYNGVKTGNMKEAPACENFMDYRLTTTPGTDKKCKKNNKQ